MQGEGVVTRQRLSSLRRMRERMAHFRGDGVGSGPSGSTSLSAMSFGRPGRTSILQPNPPDRGSFPLDHDGKSHARLKVHQRAELTGIWMSVNGVLTGECKEMMGAYLKCLQENKNASTPCRSLVKSYLDCRMQRSARRSAHLRPRPQFERRPPLS